MLSLCNFPVRSPLETVHSPIRHQKLFRSITYNHSLQKRKESSLLICRPRIRSSSLNVVAGEENHENAVEVLENRSAKGEVVVLPEDFKRELMPKHIALFPDGTTPSGKQSGFAKYLSYFTSAQKFKEIVSVCYKLGIEVVSVFAFSSESWLQQEAGVSFGMNLLEQTVKKYLETSIRKGIRLSVIGDRSKLPDRLQARVTEAEEATKNNSVLHIIVALDYDGHYDITQACKVLAGKVRDGIIQLEDIDDEAVERELHTNCAKFPNPDLFIRTSGGLKTSNFMCWQLAYSELFFVDKIWPEFEEADFAEALLSFQRRQRRFGGRISSTTGEN